MEVICRYSGIDRACNLVVLQFVRNNVFLLGVSSHKICKFENGRLIERRLSIRIVV